MDQKEIKATLKTIKENLEKKNFKSVLKLCKCILKADRNNYFALIFYGAAVQETEHKEEAPKAFKKAIEVSPNHLLAWQGLASFYEKNDPDSADLPKVYGRLLILETDNTKLPDLIAKFQKLAISHKNVENAKDLFDSIKNHNDEKKLLLLQCLVYVLESVTDISEDIILIYQKSLEDLISKQPVSSNQAALIKKYLKLLYNKQNYKKIITEVLKNFANYPNDLAMLGWFCKAYVELPRNDVIGVDCMPIYSKLLEIDPKSHLGYLCKGAHEYHFIDPSAARDSFKEAIKLRPNLGDLWLRLGKSQFLVCQYAEAEESMLKARDLIKPDDEKFLECEITRFQCLAEQEIEEKWVEGEKFGKILLEANPSEDMILRYLVFVQMKLGKNSEAKENLNKLSRSRCDKVYVKYLKCLQYKYMNRMEDYKASLEKFVKQSPDIHEPWLELGKIYYQEKNNMPCLNCFLKSTKLNQWCFYNFLYLGHCYREIIEDLEKARKCYQKAFQLNPLNAETGLHLSEIYKTLEKKDLNLKLLTTITTQNPKSDWAWEKLGMHYLSLNQYQDAVNSLRVAVRLNFNAKNAWECLGDAYFEQKAYTSALKSYQRVLEIDPDSMYAWHQIATVKCLLGFFQESVEKFRLVNEKFPNYLPSLKGQAEACLALMKKHLSENLNGLAHDAGQEGINCLMKCLRLQKDLISVWKLLGDLCVTFSVLPEKYCGIKIDSQMLSNPKKNVQFEPELNKTQLLKLGSKCFLEALCLNSDIFGLWHDLAFTYNCMGENSKDPVTKRQCKELASCAVKKSILMNEKYPESWSLRGIIAASEEIKDYPLAQHCFIKALQINDKSPVYWTNLGSLYLELGDLQLANQAFTEAQKYDHNYVRAWVGQAMIAQKTNHPEAMDLFRHSTQLGFCSAGYLGYCNLVCSTLLKTQNKQDKDYIYSIEKLNAVPVATDLLTWLTDRIPTNAWAFNMLGILLERQGLYGRAAEAFRNSLQILESAEPSKRNPDIIDKVLINYSRLLTRLQYYYEAISSLNRIQKATFTSHCELALTYFKANLYQESYSSYKTILEWLAPDIEVKSHVLVAMAAVVYLHQGHEDAKILLMQACQLKPPSVQGLFALCALGMLHSQLAMSELALRELEHFKDDPRYLNHIAIFQAYMYLFKGQKKKAIRALTKVIHRHPDQPSLWLSLSLFMLHLYPSFDCQSAAKCAEIGLILGRSSIDVSKVMSLVSMSNLLSDEGIKSLKSAQKAVHMFPDVTENWIVLVASVLSKSLILQSDKNVLWLKNMITDIRKKMENNEPMTHWLNDNDRKLLAITDKSTN